MATYGHLTPIYGDLIAIFTGLMSISKTLLLIKSSLKLISEKPKRIGIILKVICKYHEIRGSFLKPSLWILKAFQFDHEPIRGTLLSV